MSTPPSSATALWTKAFMAVSSVPSQMDAIASTPRDRASPATASILAASLPPVITMCDPARANARATALPMF